MSSPCSYGFFWGVGGGLFVGCLYMVLKKTSGKNNNTEAENKKLIIGAPIASLLHKNSMSINGV